VGNVDAGKSTMLGVLTHGELDNGRGFARQKLFRHKHEIESGRTSSVGNDILGFDSRGLVVNKPEHGHLDWVKICEDSSKVEESAYVAMYIDDFRHKFCPLGPDLNRNYCVCVCVARLSHLSIWLVMRST
jgi:GTPase